MTRTSPLEDVRTFLDAPWLYLGYKIGSGYWFEDMHDLEEIREQIFSIYAGWA